MNLPSSQNRFTEKALFALPFLFCAVLALCNYFAFLEKYQGSGMFLMWLFVPYVLCALLATWVLLKRGGLGDLFAFEWGDIRWGALSALFLSFVVYLALHFGFPSGDIHKLWILRLYAQTGELVWLSAHQSVVFPVLIVFAILEEFVWRGFLFFQLEEKWGSRKATYMLAGLYALAHVPTLWSLSVPVAGLNPVLVPGAFLASIVWSSVARVREGRLTPAILSHFFFTWAFLFLLRLV